MAVPAVPKSRFVAADFWAAVTPEHLIYFCLNVGDGDAQVLVLPAVPTGDVDDTGNPIHRRPVMIVDAGSPTKLRRFLDALPAASGGRVPPIDVIDVIVATHPHGDHISGLPDLLATYDGKIVEYWDPGYFHPTETYFKIMELLARQTGVVYVQPHLRHSGPGIVREAHTRPGRLGTDQRHRGSSVQRSRGRGSRSLDRPHDYC